MKSPPVDSVSRESSPLYIVERFVAERQTPEGLEILVQWEGYPNEEDWTWEEAESVAESVPNLVKEWNSRAVQRSKKKQKALDKSACDIEEVEKILGHRKFNGVPHYLVKWVGYAEVKDRT